MQSDSYTKLWGGRGHVCKAQGMIKQSIKPMTNIYELKKGSLFLQGTTILVVTYIMKLI